DSVYGSQTIGIGVYITQEFINTIYKPLNKFAHKGTQGHVCLIGGSYGKMGAMVLASKAALKSGCGLVTAYIPKSGVSILQTAIPEAMTLCDNQEQYISYINLPFVPSSIGIGMGLGILGETIQAFQEWLSHLNSPTVFDADAINIISKNQQLIR
ncbi:NAD(P)H-hydrate dehydratase, partial [Arthrospira platensis SPKY1]|nr:NAD(P)H-hydrate dehydratase [Arthrospira platensis SPKY1]